MGYPDDLIFSLVAAVEERLPQCVTWPLVVGLCGAQGSGKSTLAAQLNQALDARGLITATLSLDDIYKTAAARAEMAKVVHPLFATRGVPGTHDVELGVRTLNQIARGEETPLPRFNKGTDDRSPRETWGVAAAGTKILILEGWCVGARPQAEAHLIRPVNALERDADGDGRWRALVNQFLEADYAALFEGIDLLILLAAPGFGVVQRWRTEQEHVLRASQSGGMKDCDVARFVQHYERLTRHILDEMPRFADIVIALDQQRRPKRLLNI